MISADVVIRRSTRCGGDLLHVAGRHRPLSSAARGRRETDDIFASCALVELEVIGLNFSSATTPGC